MPDDLMTTTDALTVLGVDRSTLTRWVAQDKLTPVLGGGKGQAFIFRADDVHRLARERKAETTAREAGHAVPRLLAAVALAFIVAAGLPAHAGATLLVAAFVGHLFGRLFWAEVSTWGTPAGARHLEQRGRRDRTADR